MNSGVQTVLLVLYAALTVMSLARLVLAPVFGMADETKRQKRQVRPNYRGWKPLPENSNIAKGFHNLKINRVAKTFRKNKQDVNVVEAENNICEGLMMIINIGNIGNVDEDMLTSRLMESLLAVIPAFIHHI